MTGSSMTDGAGNYGTNYITVHVVDTTLTGTPITGHYNTNNAGGSFTITYNGVIGYYYVVQRTTTIGNPNSWVNLVTNWMTNPPVSYTDTSGLPGPVFYRVAWKP